jgi:hypothetical protein
VQVPTLASVEVSEPVALPVVLPDSVPVDVPPVATEVELVVAVEPGPLGVVPGAPPCAVPVPVEADPSLLLADWVGLPHAATATVNNVGR